MRPAFSSPRCGLHESRAAGRSSALLAMPGNCAALRRITIGAPRQPGPAVTLGMSVAPRSVQATGDLVIETVLHRRALIAPERDVLTLRPGEFVCPFKACADGIVFIPAVRPTE
jgi:hypothetical protein